MEAVFDYKGEGLEPEVGQEVVQLWLAVGLGKLGVAKLVLK